MRRVTGRPLRCAVTALVLQAPAGCLGEGTEPPRGREDAGRPPERIVSLVPAVTEILLELGARGRLVARTDSDPHPGLAALPSVGNPLTPSLEELTASDPDLVIAWSGIDLSAVATDRLVQSISIDRLADIGPAITDVGRRIGEDENAAELRRRVMQSLRAADRRGQDGRKPSEGRHW